MTSTVVIVVGVLIMSRFGGGLIEIYAFKITEEGLIVLIKTKPCNVGAIVLP